MLESIPAPNHSAAPPPKGVGWCCRPRWIVAAILFSFALIFAVAIAAIQPFLAVTHPVPARYLVVEGWLPEYALRAAIKEFRSGGYEQVFTTGGPFHRSPELVAGVDFAHRGETALRRFGLATNEVTAVSAQPTYRDRTFLSAVALREYCKARGIRLESFNLVSLGAHTRRSGLCFRRAFGSQATIGTIAIENLEYDPGRWWRFSEGVKEIAGETLALTYAWLHADYGN